MAKKSDQKEVGKSTLEIEVDNMMDPRQEDTEAATLQTADSGSTSAPELPKTKEKLLVIDSHESPSLKSEVFESNKETNTVEEDTIASAKGDAESALDSAETDKAVDEINKSDGDELLAVETSMANNGQADTVKIGSSIVWLVILAVLILVCVGVAAGVPDSRHWLVLHWKDLKK